MSSIRSRTHYRQPRCQPDTILVSPIGSRNHQGSVGSNLILIKFIIGFYMANLGYIRQKRPIQGKIGIFRPYSEYTGPIQVSPRGPRNHQRYFRVQTDTYKVHYRGLYSQPRLYHVKTAYLRQNRAFQAQFRQYRPYNGHSYSVQEPLGAAQGPT